MRTFVDSFHVVSGLDGDIVISFVFLCFYHTIKEESYLHVVEANKIGVKWVFTSTAYGPAQGHENSILCLSISSPSKIISSASPVSHENSCSRFLYLPYHFLRR